MASERGTGALLKIKRGHGRESTFYGGSIYLPRASQKNLTLSRKRDLDKQSDKGLCISFASFWSISTFIKSEPLAQQRLVPFAEYSFEIRQIYQEKWLLKQNLLRLKADRASVKYLDGGSRGKPRSQWDTTIDDVTQRHSRATTQHHPRRLNRFQGMFYTNYGIFERSPTDLEKESENTSRKTSGLVRTHSKLERLGSREDIVDMGVSGKQIATQLQAQSRIKSTRLPDILKRSTQQKTKLDLLVRGQPSFQRHNSVMSDHHKTAVVCLPMYQGLSKLSGPPSEMRDFPKIDIAKLLQGT